MEFTPHFVFNYGHNNGQKEKWKKFLYSASVVLGQDFLFSYGDNKIKTLRKVKKKEMKALWWYCHGIWEGGYFGNETL